MNPASTFSAARVTPNLAHAWGGVWRLTFRRFLLPAQWLSRAIGLAVLGLLFTGGPTGGAAQFLDWTINFYLTFLVPAIAFMSAGGAMRDEMKSGTVDYVLTRPVPRPAFLGFKYIAHTICMQIDFLFAFVLVLIFGATRGVPDLAAIAPKLLFGQMLMVAVFGALGFLSGVITARYVIIGLGYAGIIEAGVGQIPTQLSRLSMTHQMRDFLNYTLGRAGELTSSPSWIGTTGMMIAFCAIMLTAAAVIFTRRELSGPAE